MPPTSKPRAKRGKKTKLRGRRLKDADVLAALDDAECWLSARELGKCLGVSWVALLVGLGRLAERGLVEINVVDVAGAARSTEHSRLYRSRPRPGQVRPANPGLPAWLAPQAVVYIGEARVVCGRAGMRRGDN